MKKWLVSIIAFVILLTFWPSIKATDKVAKLKNRADIFLNGEALECTSAIYGDVHYVPVSKVFEKMGARVFYRSRDHKVIAFTNSGDFISHIAGTNEIEVNGIGKESKYASIVHNDGAYIPVSMLEDVFYTDDVSYGKNSLNIEKQFAEEKNSKYVQDVLDLCDKGNFHPDKFLNYVNYHRKNPEFSMDEVLFRVNLGLDYPFYRNVTTIENPYELLVLVNKYNKLPADFQQYNLVEMDPKYTVRDGKEYLLAEVAYENYIDMWKAAKRKGLTINVLSAHRTESYQRMLYNNNLVSSGQEHADNYSARPGFSEHQTGLAVDINTTSPVFDGTPEFRWLKKHAHEYGFILRYPEGKEWITGYAYEPWHYRYVGTEAAKIIYEEDITYEEYYAKYQYEIEFR